MRNKLPKIGEEIYVNTSIYLSHGRDDFIGGLAKVINVELGISGGKQVHYITVAERPNSQYNWEQSLSLIQEKLGKEFGTKRAYSNPDYRPEFNRW